MGPRPFVVSRAEVFGGPCRTTSRHHPSHPGSPRPSSRRPQPGPSSNHRSGRTLLPRVRTHPELAFPPIPHRPDHQAIPGLFFRRGGVCDPPVFRAPLPSPNPTRAQNRQPCSAKRCPLPSHPHQTSRREFAGQPNSHPAANPATHRKTAAQRSRWFAPFEPPRLVSTLPAQR